MRIAFGWGAGALPIQGNMARWLSLSYIRRCRSGSGQAGKSIWSHKGISLVLWLLKRRFRNLQKQSNLRECTFQTPKFKICSIAPRSSERSERSELKTNARYHQPVPNPSMESWVCCFLCAWAGAQDRSKSEWMRRPGLPSVWGTQGHGCWKPSSISKNGFLFNHVWNVSSSWSHATVAIVDS